MTFNSHAGTHARRARPTIVVALVVAGAALVGVAASPIGFPRSDSSQSVDSAPAVTGTGADPTTAADRAARSGLNTGAPQAPVAPIRAARESSKESLLDEGAPAVSNLDPALLSALRRAAADAARDDVELEVNSGWRSAEHQAKLLRAAIAEYGSAKEAARWVATPETSAHVSGDAVDIGPAKAAAWLAKHGAGYGLCRIYRNEPWHFELRPAAVDDGCPPRYADPTEDPRMQQ